MNDPLQTLCWDDLRIVKAIADHGNLVAAATALQVNHSTVSRRLTALETCLGVCLFDRRRNGCRQRTGGPGWPS
ncbi:helix-turn-helix domain-containing protein [Pseudomonas sp. A014]|uniref:helix-turn-helix domain-containing protein n=1 Tax=Pseudomonas sp. A014 TaxID=3458058 RepID=UPI004036D941